ncbi:MAG: electron transfer flavoprotein subunit alpha/FixB family protein [Desulfomonile sp.]|nr:electron transfer flavoprotein subunit alpha/FixB family protein [Desulfomonile sp.]
MKGSIAVIVEHAGGEVKPSTYEALAAGQRIRAIVGGPVVLVVLGEHVAELAAALRDATSRSVIAVEVPDLVTYSGEVYKEALIHVFRDLSPAYVCMANTTQGMDLAPGLAVRLHAACITGVEDIERDSDGIYFSRSVLGGKVSVQARPLAEVTVLTVQSGAFRSNDTFNCSASGANRDTDGEGVVFLKMECVPRHTRSLGVREAEPKDAALADARVIVAAGRGVGSRENLELIRQLVEIFPSAALAASRPLCDLEWVEYRRQVGLTGAVVAPELYVACGISGALQHVVGMRGAGFVVAINSDPNAPMFADADVCVIEDLTTFIPILVEAWRNQRHGSAHFFDET